MQTRPADRSGREMRIEGLLKDSPNHGGPPPPLDPSEIRETELVELCLRTPPLQSAWNELYRRCCPIIRSRIHRGGRCFPDHFVEDLVQEVFIRLAGGALARYRGDCSLYRYIIMISDTIRISENRKWTAKKRSSAREPRDEGWAGNRCRYRSDETAFHDGEAPCHLLSPEDAFLRSEGKKRFHLILEGLSDPLDRYILALYFGPESKNDREIGEELNLPTGTVTWRRHRALKALRESKTKGAPSFELP